MNHDQFYPALKKLSEMPEWRVFGNFLEEKAQQVFSQMLSAPEVGLTSMSGSARTFREIFPMVKRLVTEVEEERKRRTNK